MELWLPGEIFLCFQGMKENQERVLKGTWGETFLKGLKWRENREWIKTEREEVKIGYWEGISGIEGGSMDSPSLEVSECPGWTRLGATWSVEGVPMSGGATGWSLRCFSTQTIPRERFMTQNPPKDALPRVGGGRNTEPEFLPMFSPLSFVPSPRLSPWRSLRWLRCWSHSRTSWVSFNHPNHGGVINKSTHRYFLRQRRGKRWDRKKKIIPPQ